MAVLRIHKKQQNFVILDKTCLNDESLSWGAKGLHAYLISLPDNWKVRVSDLKDRARNGRDAVRGLLNELEQYGYIQKAICRDDKNGRFGGVEYLVLEVPVTKSQDENPETENAVTVKNEQKKPSPENPSLVIPETRSPLPVNPTLININRININKLNNKTAAANTNVSVKSSSLDQREQAAAVIFPQSVQSTQKIEQECNAINLLSQRDAVIGSHLTEIQKKRVRALITKLNISQKEVLIEEIEFCLLNSTHFTACGKDFSRKLNAIRSVIIRGDWQTPAGMMQELSTLQNANDLAVKKLETELRDIQAEEVHFKRLLVTAKDNTRAHFETIIDKSQKKVRMLEMKIREILSQTKTDAN
ncbi:TPA: replication protein [Legionella pneumophila]|nr:replication protein [Legionella pneumophila]